MAGMTAAFLTFFSKIRMYSLAQPLRKSAVSSGAANFGRVCTKMSRQSLYFSYSRNRRWVLLHVRATETQTSLRTLG